jgi:glyoxylase-like metal-dependent hydrolase (beta-lactamase superfamily II)
MSSTPASGSSPAPSPSALLAAALEYPHPDIPAPAVTQEVAPGVHWVRMPLPFVLDHINLWLLDDGPGVAVVDCGLGDATTMALWEEIFRDHLKGRPITQVIVTHLHPDHAGLAGWLTRRHGILIQMSQADYLMAHAWRDNSAGYTEQATLDHFRENGLPEATFPELVAARGGGSYRSRVPDFPDHYHRLMPGDTVRIGGRRWRVLVGHGHAPEHILLHSPDLDVLISGDMVLPRISTNVSVHATQPDSDPLKLFLGSLRSYTALPRDTLVLPSHGLPFRGLHERIAQLAKHHDERLAELEAACVTPKAAAEIMGTLFRRKLDGHQIWFAMGEALAHLNYLRDLGRVSIERGGDGIVRYRRV